MDSPLSWISCWATVAAIVNMQGSPVLKWIAKYMACFCREVILTYVPAQLVYLTTFISGWPFKLPLSTCIDKVGPTLCRSLSLSPIQSILYDNEKLNTFSSWWVHLPVLNHRTIFDLFTDGNEIISLLPKLLISHYVIQICYLKSPLQQGDFIWIYKLISSEYINWGVWRYKSPSK